MLTGFITSEIIFTIILIIALTAITLEIFIPSFGLIGLVGIYLLIESILAIGNIDNAVFYVILSLIIAIILSFILAKFFLRNIDNNRLVLNDDLSNSKGSKLGKAEKGLIGKKAIVKKTLRPSGLVEIDEIIYGAISSGDFLSKGDEVLVENVRNGQLYVREIEEEV